MHGRMPVEPDRFDDWRPGAEAPPDLRPPEGMEVRAVIRPVENPKSDVPACTKPRAAQLTTAAEGPARSGGPGACQVCE